MTPEEIVVKFAHSLDQFEPIAGVVAPLLIQILYDQTGAVQNLISLIWPEAAYITDYSTAFPKPARFGAYNPSINNDNTAVDLRNSAAGDGTIHPRRHRRHMGQRAPGQRDSIH